MGPSQGGSQRGTCQEMVTCYTAADAAASSSTNRLQQQQQQQPLAGLGPMPHLPAPQIAAAATPATAAQPAGGSGAAAAAGVGPGDALMPRLRLRLPGLTSLCLQHNCILQVRDPLLVLLLLPGSLTDGSPASQACRPPGPPPGQHGNQLRLARARQLQCAAPPPGPSPAALLLLLAAVSSAKSFCRLSASAAAFTQLHHVPPLPQGGCLYCLHSCTACTAVLPAHLRPGICHQL